MEKTQKVRKITLGFVLGWILGIFFSLTTLIFLIQGAILSSFISLVLTFVLFPPFNNLIRNNFNFELSAGLKIVILAIGIIIISLTIKSPENVISSNVKINFFDNPEDIFPKNDLIPSEYKILSNITSNNSSFSNYSGFVVSKEVAYTKGELFGGTQIKIISSKFKNIENASLAYGEFVNRIKEKRGYTNIDLSDNSCFGYSISASMIYLTDLICNKGNLIIQLNVATTNFDSESLAKDFKELLSY